MTVAGSPVFDGNDYRKRVLAAIERRGGPTAADPFEWYDLPLDSAGDLPDAAVAAQLAAVWSFWQKHRDHPKYRGLVTALLADHVQMSTQLATATGRRELADQVRRARTERDAGRFVELDAAVSRLVERFGGLPRTKVAGLRTFAAQAGIDDAEFERRIRRHRLVDDAVSGKPPRPVDVSGVYRQVRADLDELGRLTGTPAAASLYDLIGLPPGAAPQRVRAQRDVLATRNRERRPDRRRALIDDLLAAVTALLVDGDPDAYLDAVMVDVTNALRPRVAAAILVEDALTPADHAYLLAEAEAGGLDRARASRVLAELARQNGVSAPEAGPAAPPIAPDRRVEPLPGSSTAVWQEELSRARAELRAGRLLTARQHAQSARHWAGELLPPIRAVGDEVEALIAEAAAWWRAVDQSLAGNLFTAAATALERLVAVASDVVSAAGARAGDVLAKVRGHLAELDRRVSAAADLSSPARDLALIEIAGTAPDHQGARAALNALPVWPATAVRAQVRGTGVVICWQKSASVGPVEYRVLRQELDGALRPLGSTRGNEFETYLPTTPQPVFVVIARRAGVDSAAATAEGPQVSEPTPRSKQPGEIPFSGDALTGAGATPEPLAGASPAITTSGAAEQPTRSTSRSAERLAASTLPPITKLSVLPHGKRLRLAFPVPAAGRAEVRRLHPGATGPTPGQLIPSPDTLGPRLPPVAPGLAVDSRPTAALTSYVVLSVDDSPMAVAGATVHYVQTPAASDVTLTGDRLTWVWPVGCTEAIIAWRVGEQPTGPDDPNAGRAKLTNTRYEIDGGLLLPSIRPLHVVVFGCVRSGSTMHVDTAVHPSATAVLTG